MKKNGFTLVELLVVIILIAAIVLLALPNITNSVKNYSINVDKTTFNIIKEATKLYISDNENLFEKRSENTYCITLNELIEKDYLKNTIQYNNQDITNTKVMKVTYDNGFNYELVNKEACKFLPEDYQQVQYIESTGTQYIDIQLKGTNKTEVELEMQYTDITTSQSTRLFGARTDKKNAIFIGGYSATSSLLYINFNSKDYYSNGIELFLTKHNIKLKNGIIYVDDVEIFNGLNTTSEFTTDYNLILCGANTNGSIASAKAKYYKCKVWDNNVLLRDFIPCYRKSDNAIGMYDIVEGKFYTNQGAGTFKKGQDV